jgi:hypothetical protein
MEAILPQGYRALTVTDTEPYRYPHYHAAMDTPDNLAYAELTQVTLALFATFNEVAHEGI